MIEDILTIAASFIAGALRWLPTDFSLSFMQWLAVPVLAVYALWLFYLAIMNLKRAKDAGTMTKAALILALPIGIVGYVLDIAVNVIIGTLLFLDLPKLRHLTLSARLSDYYEADSTHWRSRLAGWLARNLLNTYDPSGQHID